eukprot:TRINITY_DN8229_c0_g1_i11.p2 TRINITY_DN8229_c0_g1~~TRINITY_DN8229_c0_g1_i11.p2  ORF type:complete len:309 (+),score=73.50 TRINITY_DN8229_c0_g1_i11:410-1336(+)
MKLKKKKKLEISKRKKLEQDMKDQRERDEDDRIRMEEEYKQPWVELEDEGDDVRFIEPDFYVDRPPTPEFIPNPTGEDKEVQVIDTELFDYDLEVEPLLEVLVGKAIEEGRIEALEDWEREELRKHKEEYSIVREAELMEAQRMEAAYNRRVEETRRRQLQEEAHTKVKRHTQEKLISRLLSRSVLRPLRDSAIQLLVDGGELRNPRDQDFYSVYMPKLYEIVDFHLTERAKQVPILQGLFTEALGALATDHRGAIEKEYQKRMRIKDKEEEKRQIRIAQALRKKEEEERLEEEQRLASVKKLSLIHI